MKLSDREILELNELCGAVVDGTLTDAQRERLTAWLRESEVVRRHYVRALGQSASLHGYAAEMLADAPDRRPARVMRWWFGAFAAAAAIIGALWITGRSDPAARRLQAEPSVARVTGASDARWKTGKAVVPGEHLVRGQRIELETGAVEITFDSGAQITARAGAALDINSAWDATLRRGTLQARVPAEAIGFRVANRAVEVVDLGTEFTMTADGREAEVLVLKGEVEAAPHAKSETDTILLREKEGRRFAVDGVQPVRNSEQKFALAREPVTLQRFNPSIGYLHWSFDEGAGETATPQIVAARLPPGAGVLTFQNGADPRQYRVAGRFGGALRFDGQLQLSAPLAGLSGATPRTIAFWVKVPDEAPLSDAYAMVAWATPLPHLGARPVQISWNRRPSEGTLGALRTDFGGGCAIGSTSLRDGKWHHVAVLFSPGDGTAPVQVKQYVDGRLESSTIIPGRIRAPAGTGDAGRSDVLWLGCRLTGHERRDHFRGEIDELFIADGLLEPEEIVRLARDNQLKPTAAFVMNGTTTPAGP